MFRQRDTSEEKDDENLRKIEEQDVALRLTQTRIFRRVAQKENAHCRNKKNFLKNKKRERKAKVKKKKRDRRRKEESKEEIYKGARETVGDLKMISTVGQSEGSST